MCTLELFLDVTKSLKNRFKVAIQVLQFSTLFREYKLHLSLKIVLATSLYDTIWRFVKARCVSVYFYINTIEQHLNWELTVFF